MEPTIKAGRASQNEEAADNPRAPRRETGSAKDWHSKIEKRWRALKKDWRDSADKAVKIYEAHDPSKHPFNILYSNTEVILPALYNSTPRPDVAARYSSFGVKDRLLDSAVARTIERSCEYFADTDQGEYETYNEVLECVVTDMLVPGLGQARVRYHANGNYQSVCFESVAYDRFVWSYARTWKNVTWVAFGHDLSQTEFEEQFPEFCKTEEYKDFEWDSIEAEENDRTSDQSPQAKGRALLVWEIWDWASRSVLFICDRWQSQYLLEEPYPRRLTSRFPCPRPLVFAKKRREMTPVTPYQLYVDQAEELNNISRRIKRIVNAIRARGVYNSIFGEIQSVLNEDDDNILVPSEGAAAFQDAGLDKQVWFMPIEQLVNTLRELYAARQECKQAIYEIMGISDIIRGASNPHETASAQNIKDKWGSLRIKKSQKQVQIFCLDLFRIATEVAAEYFTPQTWKEVTRLPYLFETQKQQIQQMGAQLMAQGKQIQAQMQQAQMAAQQGNPQAQAAVQQMQAQLQQMQQAIPPEQQKLAQAPSWEEIIAVLKGTFERSYRIDIETNSTVDLEATEDKQAIGEFMNAFGQMMAGLAPMVESQVLPFEAAKEIMAETFRRFRFGRKVSESLEQMQAPQKPADPEEIRKQVEEQANLKIQKTQADTSRQLLQKDVQIAKLEIGSTQKDAALQATQTKAELDGKSKDLQMGVRQNELKQNYEGKLKLHEQRLVQKEGQLTEQKLQQMLQEITGQIQAFRQEMAANEKAAASKEQVGQHLQEAILQLAEGQKAMMQAISAVAKVAGAEREAEIFIGPDGKKRSRSRVIN